MCVSLEQGGASNSLPGYTHTQTIARSVQPTRATHARRLPRTQTHTPLWTSCARQENARWRNLTHDNSRAAAYLVYFYRERRIPLAPLTSTSRGMLAR